MARQVLAKQSPTPAGITPAYSTPTVDGFMWVPEDHDILEVTNANAATCTVTFPVPRTIAGNAASPRSVSVPTGQKRSIRLERGLYNRPDGGADAGMVYADFSVFTSVSVILYGGGVL